MSKFWLACLAKYRPTALRCGLPCSTSGSVSDALLTLLIGTQAKQLWEQEETSLSSTSIPYSTSFDSASPQAAQERTGTLPLPRFQT